LLEPSEALNCWDATRNATRSDGATLSANPPGQIICANSGISCVVYTSGVVFLLSILQLNLKLKKD
jgi:hypothetical protein